MKVFQLMAKLEDYDQNLDVVIEHPEGGISNADLKSVKIDYNVSINEPGGDHVLIPEGVGSFGSKSIRKAVIFFKSDNDI